MTWQWKWSRSYYCLGAHSLQLQFPPKSDLASIPLPVSISMQHYRVCLHYLRCTSLRTNWGRSRFISSTYDERRRRNAAIHVRRFHPVTATRTDDTHGVTTKWRNFAVRQMHRLMLHKFSVIGNYLKFPSSTILVTLIIVRPKYSSIPFCNIFIYPGFASDIGLWSFP